MPDQRFLHPGEGESDKLTQLTDFEYRVWDVYKLAANDVGVMLDSPAPIQAINRYMRKSEAMTKAIRRALDTMLRLELLIRFRHGGEHYVCSPLWQDWQLVKYPRETHLPLPDSDARARCSDVTQNLFAAMDSRRSAKREKLLKATEALGNISKNSEAAEENSEGEREDFLHAGARNANANALSNANASESFEGEPEREPNPSPPRQPPEVPIGQLQLVVNELVGDYNARAERAGMPIVTNAEPSRNRLLNAVRLRPSMDEWRDVLDRAFRSDFLLGRVPGSDGQFFKGFNLWWLIDKDHADKALVGAYENRSVAVVKPVAQPVLGPRTKGLTETAQRYFPTGSKES